MLPRPTISTHTRHRYSAPYSYPTRAGAEPEGNRPPHAAGGAVVACCHPEAAHASTHASGVQSAWRDGECFRSSRDWYVGRALSAPATVAFGFFFHKP